MPPKAKDETPKYRALVGISYPDPKKPGSEKHIEPGNIVSDLPPKSLTWLLASKAVEEV